MIILDTNVLSESIKPKPHVEAMLWLDAQPIPGLYITSITVMELLDGVGLLPAGRRRRALDSVITQMIAKFDARHILAFDEKAAVAYADRAEVWRRAGCAVHLADGMIGAIAHSKDCAIATRDVAPFRAMGLERVINPWTMTAVNVDHDVN